MINNIANGCHPAAFQCFSREKSENAGDRPEAPGHMRRGRMNRWRHRERGSVHPRRTRMKETTATNRNELHAGKKALEETRQISAETAVTGFQESRGLSLSVRTLDGDMVNIDIRQGWNSEAMSFQEKKGNNVFSVSSWLESTEQNLTIAVSGDIDPGELAAITDLIQEISGLANDFYTSDANSVLADAAAIQFNTGELTGFTLDMSRRYSGYAAYRYQEMGPAASPNLPSAIFDRVQKVVDHPATTMFENPSGLVDDVMNMFARHPEAQSAEKEYSGELYRDNLRQIIKDSIAAWKGEDRSSIDRFA